MCAVADAVLVRVLFSLVGNTLIAGTAVGKSKDISLLLLLLPATKSSTSFGSRCNFTARGSFLVVVKDGTSVSSFLCNDDEFGVTPKICAISPMFSGDAVSNQWYLFTCQCRRQKVAANRKVDAVYGVILFCFAFCGRYVVTRSSSRFRSLRYKYKHLSILFGSGSRVHATRALEHNNR